MLTEKEKNKLVGILAENKTNKIFPSNMSHLALYLQISRQSLYNALKNNTCPEIEEKIKLWIGSKSGKPLYVCAEDLDKLEQYGFQKIDNLYVTKIYTNKSTEYFYAINEDLELEIRTKNKKGFFENSITNLDIVCEMIKADILKK